MRWKGRGSVGDPEWGSEPGCQTSPAGRRLIVSPPSTPWTPTTSSSLLQPRSLPADARPRVPPHSPPPAGVGFSKQSPSSPGKVSSEEGVQLQAGAGRASRGNPGAGAKGLGPGGGGRCQGEASRPTPQPCRGLLPAAGGPSSWGLKQKDHGILLRCHLATSTPVSSLS